jgi:hypothetical protein
MELKIIMLSEISQAQKTNSTCFLSSAESRHEKKYYDKNVKGVLSAGRNQRERREGKDEWWEVTMIETHYMNVRRQHNENHQKL